MIYSLLLWDGSVRNVDLGEQEVNTPFLRVLFPGNVEHFFQRSKHDLCFWYEESISTLDLTSSPPKK